MTNFAACQSRARKRVGYGGGITQNAETHYERVGQWANGGARRCGRVIAVVHIIVTGWLDWGRRCCWNWCRRRRVPSQVGQQLIGVIDDSVSRGVGVFQRIVQRVSVAVQEAGPSKTLDYSIRADKPANLRVIVPGVVEVQAGAIEPLPCKLHVRSDCPLTISAVSERKVLDARLQDSTTPRLRYCPPMARCPLSQLWSSSAFPAPFRSAQPCISRCLPRHAPQNENWRASLRKPPVCVE